MSTVTGGNGMVDTSPGEKEVTDTASRREPTVGILK